MLLTAPHTPKQRVAIMDDVPENRQIWSHVVSAAGYIPVLVETPLESLTMMLETISDLNVYGVLCDHRLRDHPYANFNGAEAVSALVTDKRLGILVTDFSQMDVNGTIRLHRRKIPVLIPGAEMRPSILAPSFQFCEREIRYNHIAISRKPRRSLVLVNDLVEQRQQKIVEAFVPQWNPHEAVGFPLELVPPKLQAEVRAGATLIASVNIDAESSADLFFDNFELPDKSDLQDESA